MFEKRRHSGGSARYGRMSGYVDIVRSFVVSLLMAGGLSGCIHVPAVPSSNAEPYIYEERTVIQTVDERDLVYFIDRPAGGEKVPLLILVDGSGCVGQLRPGMRYDYRPGPERPKRYARLTVEKPGVEHEADHAAACSDDFLKYYTIDNRVIDHLRVLQHLRATADWWNGEVLIWGWSDGGDIAVQLTAYYPSVTRAVLGAMGGGYTMAEHFENFWACPEEELGDERAACLEDLRAQFQAMEDDPTWKKTWSGNDNSWRVWPSRLRSRASVLLKDNTVPVLIVHGELDRENTPVESARKLVADLEAAGNTAFTYWEVPGMKHGWTNLPQSQQDLFFEAMLKWLLGVEVGPGGPPDFGAPGAADPESSGSAEAIP